MKPLFDNDKTQEIDLLAAKALGIDSFALMQKAGEVLFAHVKHHASILVVTGPGNNGGDGFVVAELARKNQQNVLVCVLKETEDLTGDARQAADQYLGDFVTLDQLNISETSVDCVVDAIFGTGLNQTVTGKYADAINWINQQQTEVLAVDIPSGLNGSTGVIEGVVVQASKTVSVLAANTGLFTAGGKDSCGQVYFESLGLGPDVFSSVSHQGLLLDQCLLTIIQENRINNSHKGHFGHVITAGGQAGMMGAVLLAGKAVLKSGAGLTTVVTDRSQADLLALSSPELMTFGFDGMNDQTTIQALSERQPDVVVLGMGLGQSQWSKALYKSCLQLEKPMVMDADALNILAQSTRIPEHLAVITPHPKEAANLLSLKTEEVQGNRWNAVKQLALKFNCVAILKGSGTLISDGHEVWCCPYGNANLATAGTGDVLAGMVAGLMAQGFAANVAAYLAVIWHAMTGESSPYGLTMTASDLLSTLHTTIQ